MKTLIITASATFFMFQAAYSQTQQQQMATIDQTKKEIDNSLASYQKSEQQKNGTSSKTVFMDGCELRLVTVAVTENNVDKKVDLYFSNGALIYATQTGTDNKTGNVIDNEKTYVNNNQAIIWIETNNSLVDNSSKKFKAMNTELMAYASQLEKGTCVNSSITVAAK